MRLRIDISRLECAVGGLLVGPVWLELGDTAFPAVGWSDFVGRVVDDWSSALNVIRYEDGVARLRVFDGSPTIRLERERSQIRCDTPNEQYVIPTSDLDGLWAQAAETIRSVEAAVGSVVEIEDMRWLRTAAGTFGDGGW